MRILVSGSRHYDDYASVLDAVELLAGNERRVTLVHGGAKGADTLGEQAAQELGIAVEKFEADWDAGSQMGALRNSEMLASGIDKAAFFLDSKSQNVGTRDAIRKARSLGIASWFYLDGNQLSMAVLKSRLPHQRF